MAAMKSSRPTTYPHPGAVLPPAQGGLGLIGFLATAVPVIWLGLGGVELAHWMQLRQSLSLILMDAARVGATRQAEPDAMARAFEQGLRRIHPAAGEVHAILARRRRDLGRPWHIAIQLPGRAAFGDHADPTLQGSRGGGKALIRNDHQAAQHAARQARGWPQGRGPQSGLTIYEANTLRITLRWPHKPLFPGASALLKSLAPLAQDARNRHWMAAGYLPFRRMVTVAMQSHPAAWPDLPDGRITHEALSFQARASRSDADAAVSTPGTPAARGSRGTNGGGTGSANGEGADSADAIPGAFDEPGVPGPDGEHPTSTTDPDGETVLEDACAS